MANVLVIGSGGREHAIVWKLSHSKQVKNIFVAPGSFAIEQIAKSVQNVDVNIKDHQKIVTFCKQNGVKLVIVGPEDPLANGIADDLAAAGIKTFGPFKDAARIESNKDWAKAFMDRHNIPTARWKAFQKAADAKLFIQNADFKALVVKASGLAAGKGVVVASTKAEACKAVDDILTEQKFGQAGETVIVEELLDGEEVSVLAFSDGKTIKAMLPAQDHKRIFDNDLGPNTGGMGAYCPCPLLSAEQLTDVQKNVLQRTIDGFNKENLKFVGVLYAGLMLTAGGPKILEFNCRFGDPETEVILPLLDSDLYEIFEACCNGSLDKVDIAWKNGVHAVGVVLASKGYPESSSKGDVIRGVDLKDKQLVFHCGSALKDGNVVTNGGRVLIVVSLAEKLMEAAARATKGCEDIQFDGKQFRKDIAHKGIVRSILTTGKLTYKQSGVDITAGNDLIGHIKPAAKSTNRAGVLGGLGGFGGLFDAKLAGYSDPILVSGTDGVGTKLKIAQVMGIHSTIGIDLVAMCVNDVLANGAEPLFFLDYFACGHLDIEVAKQVVSGVAEGCRQAGCALIGGETAEMPDMYPAGEYDLAGFTVGAVERQALIPDVKTIQVGDVVIGLPSSGVHSNGFSLVRKVLKVAGVGYRDVAAFSTTGKTIGEELLAPTKIYVKSVVPAVKSGKVKAFAHITGGGLLENIPRVLPDHLGVQLDAKSWKIPAVFSWMAAAGGINQFELLRTFNCGIGGILVVHPKHVDSILDLIRNEGAQIIGEVVKPINKEQVVVNHFNEVMEQNMKPFLPAIISKQALNRKKRVGVLISGSGTNLQALIDATQDPFSTIQAEIVLVISNKAGVLGLQRAEKAGIPTKVLNHKNYPSREEFDQEMNGALDAAGVEIVCLAGFMRILSSQFTSKWTGRLINIHPALLPLFKGTHAQKQALEAGVRVSGCSVHFVEADVDAGAIICQEVVPILLGDTEEDLIERIKTAEHKAFPAALQLLANGSVRLGPNNKLEWSL